MRIESHDLSRARKINKHFSRQKDHSHKYRMSNSNE